MDKVLFIVDVQEKYRKNFNEDYLNNLIKYIKKNHDVFSKIVCIMEDNNLLGDNIPKEIKEKLTIRPIFKCYDKEYSMKYLENSKNFKMVNGNLQPIIKIPDGDFFIKEGDGYIVGNRNKNTMYLDYLSKDLYYLMNYLRNYDIYLVGGGLHHCVKKTQDYFHFIGIESSILKTLCYEIGTLSDPCPKERFDCFIEKKND